ncbi:Hint domain-containing protein [Aliiruegeria lutimaris]|uniref:Ca2+-binding protein, RTX toxin-related n=1 Tax=Aliiruegeria lutimaris TaxID=571298 RepID=A0A1G8YJM9_9RHOB|nr:Hint domain-containing protein [Aliiruegeria lutimaris]SDK02961.1 Ca2+-binding protein, RTX toxin-related [Aliiruegeria lutimaris]
MTQFVLGGYGAGQLSSSSETGMINVSDMVTLDSSWDASTDLLQIVIEDDDPTLSGDSSFNELGNDCSQYAVITDTSGNVVAEGQAYLENYAVLTDGNGNAFSIYALEIEGGFGAVISVPELVPGVSYYTASINDITDLNDPDYAEFALAPSYDPDLAQVYTGSAYDDTITAGDGDDSIYSGAGSDIIEGGAGNDYIEYGTGGDTVDGGDGDDIIDDRPGIQEGDYVDVLSGGAGNDTIYAGGGADLIDGGTGNDCLFGEAGNDTIAGGYGDDFIGGGDGDDLIDGEEGADFILGGSGADIVQGGDGNDTIYFETGGECSTDGDEVHGGAGDDFIDDAAGVQTYDFDDRLFGDAGNDTIFGGGGDDEIHGGEDDDYLDGESGDDQIWGDAGSDTILGGAGNDSLYGGDDQDSFIVGENWGNDTVDGGAGGIDFDTLDFSNATAAISVTFDGTESGSATDGTNTVSFSEIEAITGGTGDDIIDASADASGLALEGGSGNDWISGGGGDDTITGGTGDDTIQTDTGQDTIVLADGFGNDTITDWDFSDSNEDGFSDDRLDVSNMTNLDGAPLTGYDVSVSEDASGNAVLTFPHGDTLTLTGVDVSAVDSAAKLYSMGIPCYCAGTRIMTPTGERAIEDLRAGDMVSTIEAGPQPVLWIGRRTVSLAEMLAKPKLAPIRIADRVLGNEGDLLVSSQHGMVVPHPENAGEKVLARATHLERHADDRIRREEPNGPITYIHLLFETHVTVLANGATGESFYPGLFAVAGLDRIQRKDLFTRFPKLQILMHVEKGPAAQEAAKVVYGPQVLPFPSNKMIETHIATLLGAFQASPLAGHIQRSSYREDATWSGESRRMPVSGMLSA